MAIINSLMDTDWYKITMLRAFFHNFPNVWGRYVFKCRNDASWDERKLARINEEVDHLCTLHFTEEELRFISSIPYMKDARGFIEFLRMFKLNRNYIKFWLEGDKLRIEAEGPIFIVSMFEIYILSIVNEVYFEVKVQDVLQKRGMVTLMEKIESVKVNPFKFTDFGTRRRLSHRWQDKVISTLVKELPRSTFMGTSNPYFAMKYNLVPIGTMAHEFICLGQAIEGVTLASSQKHQLQVWANEYRGDLGYALSDTLGFDKFLRDFDRYFAQLFSGMRHDSGDPFEWAEKAIAHYNKLNIDPKTKQLIFSDGLDFPLAHRLNDTFKDRALISFGIGTNLTNDVGVTPLQIVMKLVEANGRPVAKISDNPSKGMCEDEAFLSYLKKVVKEQI